MFAFQLVFVAFSLVLAANAQKSGCNFDQNNLCDFTNDITDYDYWTINKGSTGSWQTGPNSDASGNGYYIYMEATWMYSGDKVTLASRVLKDVSLCIQFSYHMYGKGMGTLNVYERDYYGGSKKKIFSKTGNQKDQWHQEEISLLPSSTKYQIVFEGVRGSSYRSDIALDEIWFTSGPCSNPTTSQPATQTPTTAGPVTPSSCGQKGYGLSSFPTRIVGGKEATPGEWPWQIALLRSNFQFCGGSLISSNHVLTAAHCLKTSDWSSVKIRVGEHDLTKDEGHESDISIAKNGIVIHPAYDDISSDYDLAIVKLATPVTLSSRVKPVCLNTVNGVDMIGKKCYISGWGRLTDGGMSADVLQEAQVPIVTHSECRSAYGNSAITDRMVCAGYSYGGTDTCQGDSGGPLVCEQSDGSWHLIGVTSWGRGCALKGFYGVYADVGKLITWVNGVVQS